jgi:hypothetical protein
MSISISISISISNSNANSGPMKRDGIIALMTLQIAILAYMAAGREYLLTYGQEVWLRTAPIDPRDPNQEPQQFDVSLSPAVRVTIRNVSAQALLLNDVINHCQFSLVDAQDPAHSPGGDRDLCDLEPHGENKHLAPGEEAVFEIDLAKPRWFVEHDGKHVTIGRTVNINRMYRLVYHGTTETDGWQGQLPSHAFNAQGRID